MPVAVRRLNGSPLRNKTLGCERAQSFIRSQPFYFVMDKIHFSTIKGLHPKNANQIKHCVRPLIGLTPIDRPNFDASSLARKDRVPNQSPQLICLSRRNGIRFAIHIAIQSDNHHQFGAVQWTPNFYPRSQRPQAFTLMHNNRNIRTKPMKFSRPNQITKRHKPFNPARPYAPARIWKPICNGRTKRRNISFPQKSTQGIHGTPW